MRSEMSRPIIAAVVIGAVVVLGCKESSQPEPPPPRDAAGGLRADALSMDHIALFQTDEVVGERLGDDADELTRAIEGVEMDILSFDRARRDEPLPDEVHAVVVFRAEAIRVWFVGPNGDLSLPLLERTIARRRPVPVRSGSVGIDLVFARPGIEPHGEPLLPSSWKAAAGGDGKSIDDIIAAVWPK